MCDERTNVSVWPGRRSISDRPPRRTVRLCRQIVVLLLVLVYGISSDATAQNATISGFVSDDSDGQPMPGVNIVLRDDDGAFFGTVSDREGSYVLARIPPGTYVLEISFIGYETWRDTLALRAGERATQSVSMTTGIVDYEEVIVQTERIYGAARITAGLQTIRPAEVDMVPSPDVSGDLAMYMSTLPGIVSVGDRGGQLYIRGGEAAQNKVLLDGMLVYQPFHILGFYSAFPSDILNEVDVYAGGHGSRYTGRISSVVDVRTRHGNKKRFAGSASIAPFVSSAMLEGPLFPGRVSFLASHRQSVIEQGAARIIDRPLPYDFSDSFAKIHGIITPSAQISISMLNTHDRGTIGEDVGGIQPEDLRWQNQAYGVRYLLLPRFLPIIADLHVSTSRLRTEMGPKDEPTRVSDVSDLNLRFDATIFSGGADFYAGGSVRLVTLENELGGLFQDIHRARALPSSWAFYLEPEIQILEGLHIRPGLVLASLETKGFPLLEPRFRLRWQRGMHQISGAAGFYQQEIVGLSDRRDVANVFTAWAQTRTERPDVLFSDPRQAKVLSAAHAILGYQVSPASWLDLSVEAYRKQLSSLLMGEWTSFPRLTTNQQHGTGETTGMDVRVEFQQPGFYGYINYGLSVTTYSSEDPALQLWYGEERMRFRPPHDRRHQVNTLLSANVLGFNVSTRWHFGSGLPFSQIIGFDGFVLMDRVGSVLDADASRRVIYERPYGGVLPTYHRLDFSIERTFPMRFGSVSVNGSVINAYDRRNIFYLDIFTNRRVDQLPLIPTLGLKVAIN